MQTFLSPTREGKVVEDGIWVLENDRALKGNDSFQHHAVMKHFAMQVI